MQMPEDKIRKVLKIAKEPSHSRCISRPNTS
ncbi:Uncharacterised protein [Vibrio cholerae]|nr:Uncharacterised protein [Vibrio cholerae]